MNRLQKGWDALWPTLIVWIVLVIAALFTDAAWPQDHDAQVVSVLYILIAEFLMMKSLLISRGFVGVDWLAISLIIVNVCFAFAYILTLYFVLDPGWPAENREATRIISRATYAVLIGVLVFGIWQLLNVENGDRREGE